MTNIPKDFLDGYIASLLDTAEILTNLVEDLNERYADLITPHETCGECDHFYFDEYKDLGKCGERPKKADAPTTAPKRNKTDKACQLFVQKVKVVRK